ncbi:plectin-like [Mytilus edulis]|uniref:plectin-like n=1 Tax=Mytilus edulis TaxID=6550 RepID=UPI0039F0777E
MDPSHAEQQEEVQPPEGNVPDLELLQNPSNTTLSDENVETRRVRDLTEKGKGVYTEKRNKFCEELEALWSDITTQLLEITTPPNELQQVFQDNLVKACTNYRRHADEYLDFLKRTRTLDSQKEIDACNLTLDLRLSKVELAMESLHEHRLALSKAKSTKTKTSGSKGKKTSHSGSSNVSDMSSLARRKRAKAEAAKSKIGFVKQHSLILQQEAMLEEPALFRQSEMEQEAARSKAKMEHEAEQEAIRRKSQIKSARVSREKSELKVKLNLLEARKEAAAAETEARILEYDDSQAFSDLPDEKEDPLQRVQDFVNKLPVSTAVKEVTGPQKKKQIPVKIELSHEAPAFVPSVALNLLSQTSAVLPSDTKSPEVTLITDLGLVTGTQKLGLSDEIPAEHQKQGVKEVIPVLHTKQDVIEEISVSHQKQGVIEEIPASNQPYIGDN